MQLNRENAAIDRLLVRQQFITAGGPERREIALTFDDGPGPYTPRVLDQLRRLHAPATFFEVGFMIHYFYDALERQLRTGDVVGDHTEQHPMMAQLSASDQNSQITVQTEQLHRYGGPFPRLYRPPYGSFNAATFAILRRLHMLMVLWSVDTEDYTRPGVDAIVARALAGANPERSSSCTTPGVSAAKRSPPSPHLCTRFARAATSSSPSPTRPRRSAARIPADPELPLGRLIVPTRPVPRSRALRAPRLRELSERPLDILRVERPEEQRPLVAGRVDDERGLGMGDVVDRRIPAIFSS